MGMAKVPQPRMGTVLSPNWRKQRFSDPNTSQCWLSPFRPWFLCSGKFYGKNLCKNQGTRCGRDKEALGSLLPGWSSPC